MIRKILIIIAALVVALLGYAATRPDTFHVERSVSIKAPPEKIFPYINDLHSWADWSPWEKMDPAMKRTYSGADSGSGAAYAWEGNRTVGQGRMEITESVPPSRVMIQLTFIKPMEGHNVAGFALQQRGDTTTVTWSMDGPMPYVAKIMSVFCSMDRMIGKDFESGLANLKTIAEK